MTDAWVMRLNKRGFAGIGVADQRDHRPWRALAAVAVQAASAANLVEFAPDSRHPVADQPPVGFDLGFARAAEEAEAAALPLEVGPASDQASRLIVEMGQFDLQPPFGRCGPLAEDFEDQAGAVDDLALGFVLQRLLLDRSQRGIDHQQFRVMFLGNARRSLPPGPCRTGSPGGFAAI